MQHVYIYIYIVIIIIIIIIIIQCLISWGGKIMYGYDGYMRMYRDRTSHGFFVYGINVLAGFRHGRPLGENIRRSHGGWVWKISERNGCLSPAMFDDAGGYVKGDQRFVEFLLMMQSIYLTS